MCANTGQARSREPIPQSLAKPSSSAAANSLNETGRPAASDTDIIVLAINCSETPKARAMASTSISSGIDPC